MTFTQISVSADGPVTTILFDRPDSLNALSPTLLQEAGSAIDQLVPDTRIVILAARGRAFSAGADLKILGAPGFSREDGLAYQAAAERLTDLLETIPQVTIAKVQGLCLTGGLEIALACDLIVAAREARFGDTHARIGFRPRWGLTQRLPRRVGIMRAREMSLTARQVDGEEAVAIGLALDAVPIDRLDARVADLAAAILANDARSTAIYKRLYKESQNRFLDDGVRYEADAKFPRSG